MKILRAEPDDWQHVRDLRVRALLDSPDAFGSTHAPRGGGRRGCMAVLGDGMAARSRPGTVRCHGRRGLGRDRSRRTLGGRPGGREPVRI
jgi:hypothetical protein